MQETEMGQENQWNESMRFGTQQLTRFIIEGGETNEHLDIDFSTAVYQQPEVLRSQVLQGVFGKHIQQTLPHCLQTHTHI